MTGQPPPANQWDRMYRYQVRWPLESDVPSVYANQFSVTGSSLSPEVVLEFGEFLPTGFSGHSDEEAQKYLDQATVKVVARVILSRDGLKALTQMLNNHLAKTTAAEGEGDDEHAVDS